MMVLFLISHQRQLDIAIKFLINIGLCSLLARFSVVFLLHFQSRVRNDVLRAKGEPRDGRASDKMTNNNVRTRRREKYQLAAGWRALKL